MCQAFSAIVHKNGKVYWEVGLDSHDGIMSKFKLTGLDKSADPEEMVLARVEITPDAGYLYPEKNWTLKIDEKIKPFWWGDEHELSVRNELAKWKKKLYSGINLEEARHPINPLLIKPHKVTEADIANLKKWDSVGASVWASVWASVRAYEGSLFTKIDKWQYAKHKKGVYPFQPAVDLWKRGFVTSYDGKIWRLHQGKDSKVVYEWSK